MWRGSQGRAVLCAVLAMGVAAPAQARPAGCAEAGGLPWVAGPRPVARAVLCLLNRVRAAHGLPRVHASRQLTLAAVEHSYAMRDGRYFAHVGRDGRGPAQRAAARGYLARRRRWAVGETLAYGTGTLATPVALVAMLMHSPPHRRVLLSRAYRDVGIGFVLGAPVGPAPGATLTVDLGRRWTRRGRLPAK